MNISTKNQKVIFELNESEASRIKIALDHFFNEKNIPMWIKENKSEIKIFHDALKGILPMIRQNEK